MSRPDRTAPPLRGGAAAGRPAHDRTGGAAWGPRERLLVGVAVLRLEWWLEWYGVRSATSRAMRHELRANLRAAHDAGTDVREALRDTGSLQDLARAAVEEGRRFHWERGLVVGTVVAAAALVGHLVLAVTFAGGLLAAGGGSGTLLSSRVETTSTGDALSVGLVVPWYPLALGVLAFLLASRPWRLLRRRPGPSVDV
ncbi:hypothetical protein [Aquipuribacter sp. SD81]|uniref:hypothetical protein n=1 Tax=Aquipuribacter sp. SD81 TaxID=3127703 RepID=UPI003016CCF3